MKSLTIAIACTFITSQLACDMINIKVDGPPATSAQAQAKLWGRFSTEDGYEALTRKQDFDRRGGDAEAFIEKHYQDEYAHRPTGKTKFCALFNKGTGAQDKRLMPSLRGKLLSDTNKYYFYVDDRYEYFSISAADRDAFTQANKRGGVCVWSGGERTVIHHNMGGTGDDKITLYPVVKWDATRPEDEAPAAAPPAPSTAPSAGAQPPVP